jgi:hypothetical protein
MSLLYENFAPVGEEAEAEEQLKDKYVVDEQCTVYLNGEESEQVEEECRTCKIPSDVVSRYRFPKKLPTANLNITLTPGYYETNIILGGKKYTGLVFCNKDYESECHIIGLSTDTNIKRLDLNQLNYLCGIDKNQISNAKKNPQIADFMDSIKRTTDLHKYVHGNTENPQVLDQLAQILSQMISKGQVDQRYLREIRGHNNNLKDYIYYNIYRIILVNASVIEDDMDTVQLKDRIQRGIISPNLNELHRKIKNDDYMDLIKIIKGNQPRR